MFDAMNINDYVFSLIQAWPCCSFASVKVNDLSERERQFFGDFMPEAVTAIVLLHHIVTEEEWTWYEASNGGARCDADDHLRALCEEVKSKLTGRGHVAELVQYPGKSGLQFRFVAQAAGLGAIGTNAFLFHPTWGPWVHLRVMATTADLDIRPQLSGEELCNQCGLCISECPADAISEESFEGLQCRSYRKTRGEYDPYGPSRQYRHCLICVWACPQGKQPLSRGSGSNKRIQGTRTSRSADA